MRWRDAIMKICHDARWIPDFGLQRELDWLKNMGDWMISKKRYWGLALPIWICEGCGAFDVIGSREELKSRAIGGWDQFEWSLSAPAVGRSGQNSLLQLRWGSEPNS